MAYPPLRSMNAELIEGATDGKYKKLRPDTTEYAPNTEATYNTRRVLSLPYYGYGEPHMVEVPGQGTYVRKPAQHTNKFELLEDTPSGAFGQTW